MRDTSTRQRYYRRCVAWAWTLLLVQVGRIPTAAQEVVGSSSGEEPWLAARMLEIPLTVPISTSSAAGGSGLPAERHRKIGRRATSAGSGLPTELHQKIGTATAVDTGSRCAHFDRGRILLCLLHCNKCFRKHLHTAVQHVSMYPFYHRHACDPIAGVLS